MEEAEIAKIVAYVHHKFGGSVGLDTVSVETCERKGD